MRFEEASLRMVERYCRRAILPHAEVWPFSVGSMYIHAAPRGKQRVSPLQLAKEMYS